MPERRSATGLDGSPLNTGAFGVGGNAIQGDDNSNGSSSDIDLVRVLWSAAAGRVVRSAQVPIVAPEGLSTISHTVAAGVRL